MKRFYLLVFLVAALLAGNARTAAATPENSHVGGQIFVPRGAPLDDVICAFCSVDAEGDIRGNLLILFGSVRLQARAHQDVIVLFSHVTAEPEARFNQDLIALFSTVQLGRHATVGSELISAFSLVRLAENSTVEGNLTAVFNCLQDANSANVLGKIRHVPAWLLLLLTPLLALHLMFRSDEKKARARRAEQRERHRQAGGRFPTREE